MIPADIDSEYTSPSFHIQVERRCKADHWVERHQAGDRWCSHKGGEAAGTMQDAC